MQPSASTASMVKFESVCVSLGGNRILDNVCARVPRGGCTAIVGPNGAGKTTLLLALIGEIPFEGRISLDTPGQSPRIGYVPQRLQFDRGIPISVLEFLAIGLQRRPICFGIGERHRSLAIQYLSAVKSGPLLERRLGALSGGELQRVLLALALVQDPELLVLDEPAAGVDFHGEHVFCELLDELRRERGFTQLMVSHDLSTVTHHATHVICLNRKVAAEGPPKETLSAENLTAIFGLHMGLVAKDALPDGKTECPRCKEGHRHA